MAIIAGLEDEATVENSVVIDRPAEAAEGNEPRIDISGSALS